MDFKSTCSQATKLKSRQHGVVQDGKNEVDQIRVDEETHRRLKEEVHGREALIAPLVREALRAYLGLAPKGKKTLKNSPSAIHVPIPKESSFCFWITKLLLVLWFC
jgi:hypothetical protein